MALPSSGKITAAMINKELGRAENAPFSLNGAAERALAGKPTGAISFADFHGKSSMPSWVINVGLYETTGTFGTQNVGFSNTTVLKYGSINPTYLTHKGKKLNWAYFHSVKSNNGYAFLFQVKSVIPYPPPQVTVTIDGKHKAILKKWSYTQYRVAGNKTVHDYILSKKGQNITMAIEGFDP
ncbi:hypothetical protein L2750_14450 [Shewanella submarina]|uniref:Phage tail protein n=1 Tax=Shewanella submarina TaxID=2016376 RepID=A0ABV7G8Q8_9GAMM|nr:hypothetical protein [Shewanella submarina]MCL1038331.1 hypothetical protein [Shewanella submarina]